MTDYFSCLQALFIFTFVRKYKFITASLHLYTSVSIGLRPVKIATLLLLWYLLPRPLVKA